MYEALLYLGFAVYLLNYVLGWLIHSGHTKLSKRQHQLLYVLILITIAGLLVLSYGNETRFYLLCCVMSLMIALPFGTKGRAYHRVISTLGLGFYSAAVFF